jgi:hypothetical protein
MQSDLRSAFLLGESYRNDRSMELSTGIIFKGIRESEPFRLHDLLIFTALSLNDPGMVTRWNVIASSREIGPTFWWITVSQLR